MGNSQRSGSHTVSRLTAHIVWVTKYRYHVLKGDVQILKGVVSKDHVHIHIEYPPSTSISSLVKRMKGRTSYRLQEEFPQLSKRYWGRHFWAIGYGIVVMLQMK